MTRENNGKEKKESRFRKGHDGKEISLNVEALGRLLLGKAFVCTEKLKKRKNGE